MNVRIISGEFGGRNIQSPGSKGLTHPMGDRVKGSLFNIISEKNKGADVLDAFAGTGSLGIEALSRGAKTAVFIERDRLAGKVLSDNIESLGLDDKTQVFKMGVSVWADQNIDKSFDIIFIDPPYDDMQFSTVKKLVTLVKVNGIMILSHPSKISVPEFEGLTLTDRRDYGTAMVSFYSRC